MDLHPSGSPNADIELLCVETNLFTLYLKGRPTHPTVETLVLHRDGEGQWINALLKVSSPASQLQIEEVKIFSHLDGD